MTDNLTETKPGDSALQIETPPNFPRHKLKPVAALGVFLLLFIISLLMIKSMTPDGLATSPDSIAYLEIAEGIRGGHGVSRPDRSLDAYGTSAYITETLWPPLYPALLATVKKTPFDTVSMQLLSAGSLCLTLIFIYLILVRLTSNLFAILLSSLSCFTIPLMLDYSYVWSETIFLALYVAIFWASVNFLERDRQGRRDRYVFLFIVAALVVALFYTRYVGLVAGLVLPYLFYLSEHKKSDLRYFILSGAICALPMVYMLAHNYLLSGSLSGDARAPSTLSIFEISVHVRRSLEVVVPLDAAEWLACFLAAIVFVAIAEFESRSNTKGSGAARESKAIVLRVAVFLTLLYVVAIIALRYVTHFDPITVRLLSPAFPSFWILLCVLLFANPASRINRTMVRTFALAVLVAISSQGWKFYIFARGHIAERIPYSHQGRSDFSFSNYTDMRTYGELPSLLTWNIEKPGIIAFRNPSVFEFVTDVAAVKLPAQYDVSFLDRLAATARPRSAGLFLMRASEVSRFKMLMEGSSRNYQVYKVEEGSLIVF